MVTADAFGPAVTHTESVGAADRVYHYGFFDNISDGTAETATADLAKLATRVANAAYTAPNPPQFLYASGRHQLTFKPGTRLMTLGGTVVIDPPPINLGYLAEPGKDYYIYLGKRGKIWYSTTKDPALGVIVGGFHTLCVDAGTGLTYVENGVEKRHPLSGYIAGDILPSSVWCLNHRPYSEPEGMVFIDSLGFWCDIYLPSGAGAYKPTGARIKSQYGGVITTNQSISFFTEYFWLVRKQILDDAEFSAAMMGSNEETVSAISHADYDNNGDCAGGKSDTNGRRMISIHGVEEGCGLFWQFLRGIANDSETKTMAWTTEMGSRGYHWNCESVIAGGVISAGANCGSRCRNAVLQRASYYTNLTTARGGSRHVPYGRRRDKGDTEDHSLSIYPHRAHTGSVGRVDRVFKCGYFDNISNGTNEAAVGVLAELADNNAIGFENLPQLNFRKAYPPRFLCAGGKRQLTFKPGTVLLRPDGTEFTPPAAVDVDSANTPGKNYYVRLGNDGALQISPTKPTVGEAAVIGGFHTLCADIGAGITYTENGVELPHPLAGYVAGDILPASVWCLNHRPYSEPEGMVFIESLGFWCDIYLASGTGAGTKSAYKGVITVTRKHENHIEDLFLVRKTLPDLVEFSAAMLGSNEETGAADASIGDGLAGGRSDTDGRRMVSIYGVEEGCGLLWQHLRDVQIGDGTSSTGAHPTTWPTTATEGKGNNLQCGGVRAGGYYGSALASKSGSRCWLSAALRSQASAEVAARGVSRHITA